jgi:hypothetical protein
MLIYNRKIPDDLPYKGHREFALAVSNLYYFELVGDVGHKASPYVQQSLITYPHLL